MAKQQVKSSSSDGKDTGTEIGLWSMKRYQKDGFIRDVAAGSILSQPVTRSVDNKGTHQQYLESPMVYRPLAISQTTKGIAIVRYGHDESYAVPGRQKLSLTVRSASGNHQGWQTAIRGCQRCITDMTAGI